MTADSRDLSRLTAEQKRQLLAEVLRGRARSQGGSLPDEYPLSHGQRALWYLHQLDPRSAAYNAVMPCWIGRETNLDALRTAVRSLAGRQAVLRASFHGGIETPFQRIDADPVPIVEVDGTSWSDEQIQARVDEEVHRPFDLERGPVFRTALIRRATGDHVLVFAVHHIVIDFWSIMTMLVELGRHYDAAVRGTGSALEPLRASYADFVRWQATMVDGPAGQRAWSHWSEALRGELPVLELPFDRPRPLQPVGSGGSHSFRLDGDLVERLRSLARAEGLTPYVLLLTALAIVLHRYSGQDDIIVGSPMSGRPRSEFDEVVGYFMNPVPLRSDLGGDPSLRELLGRTRATVLGALEHQDYPSTLLVDRLKPPRRAGRASLFDVMFVLNRPLASQADGLTVSPTGEISGRASLGALDLRSYSAEQRTTMFDLSLNVTDVGGALVGAFIYGTEVFDQSTIARLTTHYVAVLDAIASDPDQPVSEIRLPSSDELATLAAWSTGAPASDYTPVHRRFETQARLTPDAPAVEQDGAALSYGELNRRANRLAWRLRRAGVGPDVPVAVAIERSPNLIVALLAVLKAGGAYVPLDPTHPAARIGAVLADVAAPLLLSHQRWAPELAPHGVPLLCLDTLETELAEESDADPAGAVALDSLAYLIYTSGSTGRPKGVMVPHRALAGYTGSAAESYDIGPTDRVLQFASISFDAAAEEIYPTLATGGTLVLRTDDMIDTVATFLRRCDEWGITVLDLPTAYWHEVVSHLESEPAPWPAPLRLVILGGEKAIRERFDAWRTQAGARIRLVNTYGPTEGTIVATAQELTDWSAPAGVDVPIGRPVPGVRAYVLDGQRHPAPIGVPGDLFLAGANLARGYFEDPALTADRFLPDPFSAEPNARMYRTGDRARFRGDGTLEFLGRSDFQVKLRGYRIELGDIEAAIRTVPGVQDGIVVLRDDGDGPRLVGYWVGVGATAPDESALRASLKRQLPAYMVPAALIQLDRIPLSATGKVDRKALPAPPAAGTAEVVDAPRTETELRLQPIWEQALGRTGLGRLESFFDLGGHSLLATRMLAKIRREFQLELPVRVIFEHSTIAELGAHIDATMAGGVTAPASSRPRAQFEI